MQTLPAGGNAPLPQSNITVTIAAAGAAADISAFRLYADGKVRGDSDMIFYNQLRSDDGAIILQNNTGSAVFTINLAAIQPDVSKVAFTLTCDPGKTAAAFSTITATVSCNNTPQLQGEVKTAGRSEAALIVCEIYRHKGVWKFRFVAQGFNGGLKALAEHFGVDVADDSPAQSTQPTPAKPAQPARPAPAQPAAAPPSQPPPINLSKVTLTKEQPTISLTKQGTATIGKIRINLNWNRGRRGGFFSSNRAIDLDLGAFIRLQNGERDVIQALGRRFGSFTGSPWVNLLGDDRTGESSDGEWLEVNGDHWDKLQEILIYTFIYEGASNWGQTDGVTTIYVPNNPPVETRLTGGDDRKTLCAIARLVNSQKGVTIERLNRYFRDQEELDNAYNWGFSWGVGRK